MSTGSNQSAVSAENDPNLHRQKVGGEWEKIGKLQFRFMKEHGLKPSTQFLDIGCGCFRGGIHFIKYLDHGNYYGIDRDQSLINAGVNIEISRAGIKNKFVPSNVICNETFEFNRFDVIFDMALAQSLFTHLEFDAIRQCLAKLTPVMRSEGVFYATFFECPDDIPFHQPFKIGDIITYPNHDPFHYRVSDLARAISGLPWHLEYLGEWHHPRRQMMAGFHRL